MDAERPQLPLHLSETRDLPAPRSGRSADFAVDSLSQMSFVAASLDDAFLGRAGDDVSTDVLLLAGVATAIVFAAVLLVEGARRPGYDPSFHTGSELDLGEWGLGTESQFFAHGPGSVRLCRRGESDIEH